MTKLERTGRAATRPAAPQSTATQPAVTPVLRTERLILRAPRPADATVLATLLDDRRIAENTARIPHPYTRADAEAFIAAARQTAEPAFLIERPDGEIGGGCGLARLRGDTPEIGYWIAAEHWGNGYAREGAAAVIAHAFTTLGEPLLHAGARVTNAPSRRILEACGFEWTNVVLQRVRALNTSVPCDRFKLERPRWESLQATARLRQRAGAIVDATPRSHAPMRCSDNACFPAAG